MIINHPVLNRFSPSIKEIIPQTGDDAMVIPNTLQMMTLPPEPLFLTGSSVNPQESSFGTGTSLTVANGGPTPVTMATLRPGLWRIRVSGCYLANYVSTLQGGDLQIILGSPTQGLNLLTFYAVVGTQSFDTEVEVLLPSNHTIGFTLNVNGVGNSHQASASVVCNKLL